MNNKEIEIRIADLFAMLLKAFVPIVCVILIAGLLGGAYGVYKIQHAEPSVKKEDVDNAETAVTKAENAIKSAERSLKNRNEIEIPDAARKVESNKRLVERRQEYLNNSLYQQLDAFNCGKSSLTFYIKTDFEVEPDVAGLVEDPRNSIAMAYANIYLFDDEIVEHLRTLMHTTAETQYIQELVSVKNNSDRFVEITVLHEDAKVAEQVVNYLFETMQARLKDSVAPHAANVIAAYTGYEVNWSLYDTQVSNEDNLISAERALDNAEESYQTLVDTVPDKEQAIAEAKTAYDDAVKELEKTKKAYENTIPSKENTLKSAGKYGLIGLVAGLVLGSAAVLAINLLNGKLHNQSEVRSRFPFPLLGVLPRTKKILFEKTVRKLEGESLGAYDAEAMATAQSVLQRIGDRSICLISSAGKETAEKLAAFTDGKTPVCGNILSDADAVRSLSAYDGVILVEQKGKSRIDLIENEVLRIKALDKEPVGIVLL